MINTVIVDLSQCHYCCSSMASFSVGVVFHLVFVLKVSQNKGESAVNICSVFFIIILMSVEIYLFK